MSKEALGVNPEVVAVKEALGVNPEVVAVKEVLGVNPEVVAVKEVLGVMTTPPKGVGIAKSVQLTLKENEEIENYCKENGISFSVFARLAFKMMGSIDFVESVKETVKAKHYRVENREIVRDKVVDTEI